MSYKGKIYKLVSSKTDKIYIGSTTRKYLNSRLSCHKYDYECYTNKTRNKHYMTSFEIVKYDDCRIEVIEEITFDHKYQLLGREGYHINNNINICVNKIINDGLTPTEKHRKHFNKYLENNRDKWNKYQNEYKKKKRMLAEAKIN